MITTADATIIAAVALLTGYLIGYAPTYRRLICRYLGNTK